MINGQAPINKDHLSCHAEPVKALVERRRTGFKNQCSMFEF